MPPKHKEMKFTQKDLEEAVSMVRTKQITYCNASLIYGIPKLTLSDHVNGIYTRLIPLLNLDIEEQIYNWLIKMARIGYGQSKEDLFNWVQKLVMTLNIATPFVNGHPSNK